MAKLTQLSQIQGVIDTHADIIRRGYILCVDPSAGSGSSMPGYAIYRAGELIESGTLKISQALPLHARLHQLGEILRNEFEIPDVLLVEFIGGFPFGVMKFNINAFHSLIKSVGAIISAFPINILIEVPPVVWKKYIDDDYVKNDEADAVYLGRFLVNAARGTLPEPREFARKPRKPRKPRVKKETEDGSIEKPKRRKVSRKSKQTKQRTKSKETKSRAKSRRRTAH